MPIGDFARRSGLTPSALRFHADCGLLRPAEVDPFSGYRYYGAHQVPRAVTLRRLREAAMPLTTVEAVLDAGPDDASRLIDEHVAKVLGEAAAAQRPAMTVKASLTRAPAVPVTTLKGPVLADAVEQVLTATAREPGMPALGGLRVEATPEAVTLTATDRYRLSTRTLATGGPGTTCWAATIEGDDLRAAVPEVRRSPLVRLEATPHGMWLRLGERDDRHCRPRGPHHPRHARPGPTLRVSRPRRIPMTAPHDRHPHGRHSHRPQSHRPQSHRRRPRSPHRRPPRSRPPRPDPTMEAIGQAVAEGHAGRSASARRELLDLWATIGVTGDPLHRCTLAHHLADLCEDPAEALTWDLRALDAADALTEQRAQEHHAGLRVAGFHPSLHLNLADDHRRLGSFRAAAEHIEAARRHAPALPDGPYGAMIRTAVDEVAEAITRRDTSRRSTAPGPAA
ncbi:MerR family transcriptional regulator [Streptomyces sp. WAC05374]|uniref:DNA polymerase III subunit beta family protein n=1 Tax=Streptomyces sp. WAC05374 TaxID=2487420 RepID=UPI0026B552EC